MTQPVRPLPAATLVLLRDSASGDLEMLLLRRSERAGFVPGGFVFPGGLVDPGDADAVAHVRGLSAAGLAERLALPNAHPPAVAYFVAAVRETFEETGLLVGVRSDDSGDVDPGSRGDVTAVRAELLEGRIDFAAALTRLRSHIAADELAYFAHWITPELAPRRYDTRFFAARLHGGGEPILDSREMTEARWTTPAAALGARESEGLKMMLPTIKTLEHLATFSDTGTALAAMRKAVVATNLPASVTEGFDSRPAEHRLAKP
jgi:8-oxo-dGTP pyrophosphatase MutT (NUDIX family)